MGVKLCSYTKKRGYKVSEKWTLRRIFRPKNDEVTGGWKRLHNEALS
jgi:hypothetical protein